jgi:hypothetical protein
MDEKQLQLLYNEYAKGKGFKDYGEFKTLMMDEANRKLFFEDSNQELGFKDYGEFTTLLGVKKKEATPSPKPSAAGGPPISPSTSTSTSPSGLPLFGAPKTQPQDKIGQQVAKSEEKRRLESFADVESVFREAVDAQSAVAPENQVSIPMGTASSQEWQAEMRTRNEANLQLAHQKKEALLKQKAPQLYAPIKELVSSGKYKNFFDAAGNFKTGAAIEYFDKVVKEKGGGSFTRDMLVATLRKEGESLVDGETKEALRRATDKGSKSVGQTGMLGKTLTHGWYRGLSMLGNHLASKGVDNSLTRYMQGKDYEAEQLAPGQYKWNSEEWLDRATASAGASLGASLPTMLPAAAITIGTGGAGGVAVGGTLGFYGERAMNSGGIYDEVLKQTGDPALAREKADEFSRKQAVTLPLYYLDALTKIKAFGPTKDMMGNVVKSTNGLKNLAYVGSEKALVGSLDFGQETVTEFWQGYTEAQAAQDYQGSFGQYVNENSDTVGDVLAAQVGSNVGFAAAGKIYRTLGSKTPSAKKQFWTEVVGKEGPEMANQIIDQQVETGALTEEEAVQEKEEVAQVAQQVEALKPLGVQGEDAKAYLALSEELQGLQAQMGETQDPTVLSALKIKAEEVEADLRAIVSGQGAYVKVTYPGGARQTAVLPIPHFRRLQRSGEADELIQSAESLEVVGDEALNEEVQQKKGEMGNASGAPEGFYENEAKNGETGGVVQGRKPKPGEEFRLQDSPIPYRINPVTGKLQQFSEGYWNNSGGDSLILREAERSGFILNAQPSDVSPQSPQSPPLSTVPQGTGVEERGEMQAQELPQQDTVASKKTFDLDGKQTFFHASPKPRSGRLRMGTAPQFGTGVYFSTSKDKVTDEFGDHVTEAELAIEKPVYTNTPEWHQVQRRAIQMADEAYAKRKGLKPEDMDEDLGYHRYDPDNMGELDEIDAFHISNAAKELGYDAIIDKGSRTYENEIIVLDESKIIYPEDNPADVSPHSSSTPTTQTREGAAEGGERQVEIPKTENNATEPTTREADAYNSGDLEGSQPEIAESKPENTNGLPPKEGFTESKDLNEIYRKAKEKYGDKKGAQYFEAANRLVNPNKNTIIEVRSNGVVVYENGKYILKPFGNTDVHYKKWTLYKGIDVSEHYASKPTDVSLQSESPISPSKAAQPSSQSRQEEYDAIISGNEFIDGLQEIMAKENPNESSDRLTPELGDLLERITGFRPDSFTKEKKQFVITHDGRRYEAKTATRTFRGATKGVWNFMEGEPELLVEQWLNAKWDAKAESPISPSQKESSERGETQRETTEAEVSDISPQPEEAGSPGSPPTDATGGAGTDGPSLEDLSGIKKALVPSEVRETVDFARLTDTEMMNKGRELLDSGAVKPRELINRIVTEKKGVLTPEEVVALIVHKADLDNALRAAYKKKNEAATSGEEFTGTSDIQDLELQLYNYQAMSLITANQQSLAFRLRQQLLDSSYNALTQIERYKAANNGYIDPATEAFFKEKAEAYRKTQDALRDEGEKIEAQEGAEAIQNIQEDLVRKGEMSEAEVERRVQEGVQKEIDKIYEALDPEKKSMADKAIAALENIQKKLRGRAYESTLGIPVAIIDFGITVTKRALKVGIYVTDAIELGIKKIKEKLNTEWAEENEFRQLMLDGFKQEGIATEKPKVKPEPVARRNKKGELIIPPAIIRGFVKNGETTIEGLTEKVLEVVKDSVPDATARQVRDAITGYGREVNPTRDDLTMRLNQMRRVGKLISELEDLQAGIARERNPVKKAKRTAQEEELLRQIRALSPEVGSVVDAAAKARREEERKLQAAMDAAQESLNEYERRIRELDFSPKEKKQGPTSPELEDLRKKRDEKRKEYEELKRQQGPKKTDAQRLSEAKTRLKTRIKDMETRLKKGEYTKKKPQPVKADDEYRSLLKKADQLRDEIEKKQYEATLRNRPIGQKIEDWGKEIFNGIVRGLVAAGDLSFMLVQGGKRWWVRPNQSLRALGKSFQSYGREQWIRDFEAAIKTSPRYADMKRDGVAFQFMDGKHAVREDILQQAGWLGHGIDWLLNQVDKGVSVVSRGKISREQSHEVTKFLNVWKNTAWMFNTYMNSLRYQAYEEGYKYLTEKKGVTPEMAPKDFEKMADNLNTLSSRASLGKAETSSEWLNIFMFSVRKVVSEMKLFTPYVFVYYARMPKYIRQKAALEFLQATGTMVAANIAVWALAKDWDDEDEDEDDQFLNPTSTNFLSHKVGTTYIDVTGGLRTMLVFQSRLLTGEYTDSRGKAERLGDRYGKPINTRMDLAEEFAWNKLAPTLGFAKRWADQRKGQELDWTEEGKQLSTFMWMQDVDELHKDHPGIVANGLAALAIMGAAIRADEERAVKAPETLKHNGRDVKLPANLRTQMTERLTAVQAEKKAALEALPEYQSEDMEGKWHMEEIVRRRVKKKVEDDIKKANKQLFPKPTSADKRAKVKEDRELEKVMKKLGLEEKQPS